VSAERPSGGSAPTASAGPPPTPRRGRPRSDRCDQAILDAALRLIGEEGYARMSMEGIAAAAGVSKPTIYLRYRSKADLASRALERLRVAEAPAPTGDLRADLVAHLRHLRATFERVGMSVLGTCLMEERHTPELMALLRERSVLPGRLLLRDLLETARGRGELAADADLDTAVLLLSGAYYAQHVGGEPPGAAWEERVVDAAMRGLGAGRAGGPPA
jgi:AcrR family transcriptional regulator